MDQADDLRFKDPEPRIHPTAELKSCRLGRYAAIGERVVLREVSVGDFSYFERHAEAIYTEIGKFCSIAANTRINALEHPIERITQHKVSYRPNEYFRWLGVDAAFKARRQAKTVRIGHDVWIGHGAVVHARRLDRQWRDGRRQCRGDARRRRRIEIVAGVPARTLRLRFRAGDFARIERLAWWDWPVARLADAMPDMQSAADRGISRPLGRGRARSYASGLHPDHPFTNAAKASL